MTKWRIYFIFHAVLVVLRYPLAVLAVLAFSTPNKRHLTRFTWMETIDNDLSGDSGWKEQHLIGRDPLSALNRIRWLWRNGANAVNYGLLGVDEPVSVVKVSEDRWEDTRGNWLVRSYKPFAGRYVEKFYGWNLLGPQHGRCKFVASVRFPKTVH